MIDDDDDDDGGGGAGADGAGGGKLRLDKWLWFARFLKTRSLAAKFCASGVIRRGGAPINKAHDVVRPGDVLTFPQGRHIRVIKVVGLGARRGPAEEARLLYEDLSPPSPETALPRSVNISGGARPTKKDRRAIDEFKSEDL